MKTCATCGTPHPDDVTTSHHPDSCRCGYSLCGGTGPKGCIWSRVIHVPPEVPFHLRHMWALSEYGKLILERDETLGEGKLE